MSTTDSAKIEQWLSQKRSDSGISIRKLAQKSDVSISMISRIENEISEITISTLVKLCHGLGKVPHDLLNELGLSFEITPYKQPIEIGDNPLEGLPPTLVLEDLSVFYEYYISETRQAKRDLYHLKYATQNEEHIHLTNIDPEQEVFEKAFHTIWGEQDFLTPYPYPKDLKPEVIKQIFKQKGIITYQDIGHYLRVTRTSSGQVMEDVEDFTGISHPTLSRIERGQSTRIRFEDIIAIDDFFNAGGTIAGMFWRAAEFHTGVLLNKSLVDGKSKPPIEWGQLRRRIADVIIMIHRLQKSYFNDDNNWLNELRLRLKPYYLNIATKFYEEATFEDELDPNIDKGELYKRTTRFVRQYLASQYLQNTSTSLQITIERGQTLWSFIKRHLSTSDYKDFFQLTLEDLELSPNSATLDGINYLIKKLIQNDDSFASELHRLLAKLTANTNI